MNFFLEVGLPEHLMWPVLIPFPKHLELRVITCKLQTTLLTIKSCSLILENTSVLVNSI